MVKMVNAVRYISRDVFYTVDAQTALLTLKPSCHVDGVVFLGWGRANIFWCITGTFCNGVWVSQPSN